MWDYKDSDDRYQISKNDEERVTGDIQVFKQGKLSSKKNDDNIEKLSDERNWMDISDYKYYDEIDQTDRNDEKRVTN